MDYSLVWTIVESKLWFINWAIPPYSIGTCYTPDCNLFNNRISNPLSQYLYQYMTESFYKYLA